MIEVLFLAIALAMDAFAVSIGLGAKQAGRAQPSGHLFKLAVSAALYFGIAQGIMPLIGYLLGSAVLGWLASAAPWIGCIILIGLGAKMFYEALHADDDSDDSQPVELRYVEHKMMLSLAIATSIDALAAGFTLNLMPINAWFACSIIALVTLLFSFGGVYLGHKSGTWLEDKAEMLGGVVLIAIGIHMVL